MDRRSSISNFGQLFLLICIFGLLIYFTCHAHLGSAHGSKDTTPQCKTIQSVQPPAPADSLHPTISASLIRFQSNMPLWKKRQRRHASDLPTPAKARLSASLATDEASNEQQLKIARFESANGNEKALRTLRHALERIYDTITQLIHDLDFLDEHELIFQVGAFTLEFDCLAGHMSALAVKAVVRHIGQMLQSGLTGMVTGEVVDVRASVRILFAFGVWLRIPGQ